MQFKSKIIKLDSNVWAYAFLIPAEVIKALKTKRVVCKLNGKLEFQTGVISNFIKVNKEIRDELGLIEASNVDVELKPDVSKYGLPTPAVFLELIEQDPEGDKIFHSLTPGKQRSLIYIIAKPKSEAKQLEKTLIIFEYLKSSNGNLDYKELNLALKNK